MMRKEWCKCVDHDWTAANGLPAPDVVTWFTPVGTNIPLICPLCKKLWVIQVPPQPEQNDIHKEDKNDECI
jgi:hypothetical protein